MGITSYPLFLRPTADNFRAERARYRLELDEIGEQAEPPMGSTLLSMYINEYRPMRGKTILRIAEAFNRAADRRLFLLGEEDDEAGAED